MKKHVLIIGILHIASGIIGSLYIVVAALPAAMGMELVIGPLIAGLLAIGAITGVGLLRFKTWDRKRAVGLGIIYIAMGVAVVIWSLFEAIFGVYIPVMMVGMVLGIYTLWGLSSSGTSMLFTGEIDKGGK